MIRAMTPAEIRKALRRAAAVCIEHGRLDWWSMGVCIADGTAWAASGCIEVGDGDVLDPEHAAFFLLMVAAAMEPKND